MPTARPEMVRIDQLCMDGGTQPRVVMSDEAVDEYAAWLTANPDLDMPPISCVRQDKSFWPYDGFHRVEAYKKAGRESIPAEVRIGTLRDAILLSKGVNYAHGVRSSQADRRNAVKDMLQDKEWGRWSDRKIGEHCHVDHKTVSKIRAGLSMSLPEMTGASGESPQMRTTERNGRTYQVNTTNIGRKPSTAPDDGAYVVETEPMTPDEQRRAARDINRLTGTQPVDEDGFPAEGAPEPSITPMGVDGWGIPIQPHAAEAFANVPEFDELIRLLKQADKLYSQLAELPGGKRLTKWGVSQNTRHSWKSAHIQNAIKAVQDCKPKYTVCPYKHNSHQPHDDKDCTLCYGFGWLPEVSKDRIPADLIANAKAAYGVDDDV